MKLSDRMERARRLYGKGMVVAVAGVLACVASFAAAFVIAAGLQLAFGWSSAGTERAFWIVALLGAPLPLGALLSSYPAGAMLSGQSVPDRQPGF